MPHGSFNWNELQTNDVEKAKAFYKAAVGWSFEGMPMPDGTYWIAKQGEARVGGITQMNGAPAGTPPHWFAYLEVDDVNARVQKVASGGGKVVQEPFDIPGVGRIAVVADATGAAIGWITPQR